MSIDNATMTAKDPRDGQVYKVVIIGEQIWLGENLRYKSGLVESCYDEISENCVKYGVLYNWESAQNVAPAGWRIPSRLDLESLMKKLGKNDKEAYVKIIDGGASGFNAKLGGYMRSGGYFDLEHGTAFWSATEIDGKNAWACYVYKSLKSSGLINYKKDCGFHVRLIKDEK